MANLCAKLKQREKNKYRKIVSTDEPVYSIEDITVNTFTPYVPGAALEEGEWFSVQNASTQEYKIDLLTTEQFTIDFNSMNRNEFGSVDFVFTEIGNLLCFQNVSKARLVLILFLMQFTIKTQMFCISSDLSLLQVFLGVLISFIKKQLKKRQLNFWKMILFS